VPRSRLYDADEVDAARLEPLLERREAREPLAYVLGEWGFRRLTLKTDSRALVPRPETEKLVERALALIAGSGEPRVLDVGVGSGAIALAIKDEAPRARVTGVDTSPGALELAGENAKTLGLEVDLRLGGVDAAAEGWDLVVANPPYVASDALPGLQPELRWEPEEALVGDGFHSEIARVAATRAIAFEVADGEARVVAASLARLGYDGIAITRDLAGTERVVEGRSR
jgi:release factor glutamine methyltransferase